MSAAFLAAFQLVGAALPLINGVISGVEGLVAVIQSIEGITPAQKQALIDVTRTSVAAEVKAVQATPVFVPAPT